MSTVQAPWPTKRIRFATRRTPPDEHQHLVSQATEVTFLPMKAIGEQGGLDLSAVRDINEVNSGYVPFFDGDVVVAKITPCFENGKGALVSGTLGGVGFGTTELYVLTPISDLNGRFLYFITVSAPFRQLGAASMTGAAGQKRVPEEFVRDYRIPIPPLPQQRAIANYLDPRDGAARCAGGGEGAGARTVGREAPGAYHPRRYARSRPSRPPPRLRHPLAW